MQNQTTNETESPLVAQGVDEEIVESNRREYAPRVAKIVVGIAVVYAYNWNSLKNVQKIG